MTKADPYNRRRWYNGYSPENGKTDGLNPWEWNMDKVNKRLRKVKPY